MLMRTLVAIGRSSYESPDLIERATIATSRSPADDSNPYKSRPYSYSYVIRVGIYMYVPSLPVLILVGIGRTRPLIITVGSYYLNESVLSTGSRLLLAELLYFIEHSGDTPYGPTSLYST